MGKWRVFLLEQQTFSSVVEQFILERKSRNRSHRTIELYKLELSYFSKWLDITNHEKQWIL